MTIDSTTLAYVLFAVAGLLVAAWALPNLGGVIKRVGQRGASAAGDLLTIESDPRESLHQSHDVFARHFAARGDVERVKQIGELYVAAVSEEKPTA